MGRKFIPSRTIRNAGVWVLLIPAAALLAACEQKPAYQPPPPPKVTVSQPVRQDVTDYLELTGNTQAVNTVQLRARVEGFLEKVFFRDGDIVKKDQLLFLIQQNTYLAQLQQAEGNVLNQKASLEHANTEFTRYTTLVNQKAASQTDLENWRYQRDSAQAGLMTAEAARDLAKLNFGYTWVVAPFSGRINRRMVDPGNLVSPTANTVLAELVQEDPLYVYFNVSETDLSRVLDQLGGLIKRGDNRKFPVHFAFAGEEGYPHEGYLDFAAPTVTSATGTELVRGVLPNPDMKMLPGQFARVRLPVGKERSAILIPRVAVGYDQQGSYVMTVNDKNVVERKNLKTGAIHGEMIVVEEGLQGNEWIIVNGLLKAIPGKPVNPEREKPSQAPAEQGSNPDQR